jgi:hypothetical protein
MYVVVVLEFHQWKQVIPIILPLVEKEHCRHRKVFWLRKS